MHAVGFARGQTARTLAWQLGRQLGYGPTEPDELLGRLRADPRPVLLAVTDLHQAGRGPAHLPSGRPGTVVDDLLAPLLGLPDLRLIIETEAPELARTPDALVLTLEPADDAHPVGAPLPGPRPESAVTPAPPAPGRDWRTASADEREHALDRALTTGTAHELLRDPGYLVYGSVPAITATLEDPAVPLPSSLRAVWADAAPALSAPDLPDSQRAAVLHAAAAGTDPRLAEYLRPLAESGPGPPAGPGRHDPRTPSPSCREPPIPTAPSSRRTAWGSSPGSRSPTVRSSRARRRAARHGDPRRSPR